MKKTLLSLIGLTLIGALLSTSAYADLFTGDITVCNAVGADCSSQSVSYRSISDIVNAFSNDGLENLFPTYNGTTDTVTGTANLRGLAASFTYSGTELVFSVPAAGITETFNGATRQDSLDDLQDWFKGDAGAQALTQLLQAMVAQTPYDPIAGNPSSLMAQLNDSAYFLGTNAWTDQYGTSQSGGLFSLTPSFSNSSMNGVTQQSVSLPIGYAHYFNYGRTNLFVDFPIQYSDTQGSKSYSLQLGLGLQQVLMRMQHFAWSLTPSLSIGTGASTDLGALAGVYQAALKNQLHFSPFHSFFFDINNMVAYLHTQSIKVGDYSITYDLHNLAYSNGADATYLFTPNYGVSSYFDHVIMTGSSWYISHYNEVGLNLMKVGNLNYLNYDQMSIGAGYEFAANFHAYSLNMNFMF